ncbi:TonB-dependent receptor [Porphyrobacter sp. HT-58-2]|uniref:TonB-dependent receptor n=1 Tax=Porphyrobacter sp. HT-58-2 TaxID=2023229 RepID=UPI001F174BBF|nr:TonB-dependent receptor [Porphyrobacter sp. HT-58-2]
MKSALSRAAKMRLLVGTSLAVTAMPLAAQDAEPASGATIGEIVVTAQKREQNLQEVPLAISVLGSEKLQQLQVNDARDLSGLAPNVTVITGQSSNNAAVISMRGITSPASETFGLDTANALYLDGIYIARSGASGMDMAEVERVEVLRGPQGTLFGRNTTGGAIAFVTRAPSDEFGIRTEIGYGNYNAFNGRIAVDTGLIGGAIKATLSYARRQRDGTVDDLMESRDSRDPGSFKTDSFRGALRADIGTTGYVQYIFDWTRTDGTPLAFQLTNVADGTPRPPLTVNGVQIVQTQQAPVAQYLANATFTDPRCAALAVPTRAFRDRICLDDNEPTRDKIWGHNFQIYNDFGGFAAKLVTGYRRWNNTINGTDFDGMGDFSGPAFSQSTLFNGFAGTPAQALLPFVFPQGTPQATIDFVAGLPVPTTNAGLFTTSNDRRHEQFQAELEFSGDTDTLDWVVGGFYFWEEGSELNPQLSGFVLDTNTAVFSNFGPLSGAFQASNPARYRLVVTPATLSYSADADSKAVYSQVTYYPGGRDSGASITAGARYTWDDKGIIRTQNGAAPLATPQVGDASFSKLTWNLMGRYEFSPEASVYARVATGYRSGGFNASDPLSTDGSVPNFDEEEVTSYELGVKTELFDRRLRLNVAGYHNIFEGLAVFQPTLTGQGTFQSVVRNAGKVEYTGIEADFQAAVSNTFSFDGSIGYVDVKFKELLAGQPVVAADGVQNIAAFARPAYTSPFTANFAANAVFPLGSNGTELRARVGYTYEDGKYSFNNTISSPFNEQIRGDNVNLVDAQIVIDKIPLSGGEARIMIWGKNLFDDNNLLRGIDFGPLGYAGGIFGLPRTFGVTFGFNY